MFAIMYVGHGPRHHRRLPPPAHPPRVQDHARACARTLAILGSAAIEGPVISWVADHRKHHAFSDAPGDPHSPHVDHGHGLKGALRGLLHAHVGWLFIHTERGSHERYAPDLLADPTIRWVNKWFFAWAIGGLRRGVRARLADRRLPSHGSHRTAVGWGRAHAGPAPRDLLDQLAVPLLRAPPVRDEGRVAQPAVAGDPLVRRVVAQQPSRLPDLGRARHAPAGRSTPRRWSSALLEKLGLAWDVVRVSPEKQAKRAVVLSTAAAARGARGRAPRAAVPRRAVGRHGAARPRTAGRRSPLRSPQALGHVLRVARPARRRPRVRVRRARRRRRRRRARSCWTPGARRRSTLRDARAARRRGRARGRAARPSRTCPTPSCARAAAATASRATAAPSATTTTSPTSSSSSSSASR